MLFASVRGSGYYAWVQGLGFLCFLFVFTETKQKKNCHVAKDISQRGMVLIITMHRSGENGQYFSYLTFPYSATQENSSYK